MLLCQFVEFFDQIKILWWLLCCTFDIKVRIFLITHWICHQSLKHGLEWNIEVYIWFLWIFSSFIGVHIGQLGITFGKHVEIQLNDRK
jgi:hypothetical protein